MWPAGVPCVKLYQNGQHVIKGPGPNHFVISLKEVYQTDAGYDLWIKQLVPCQKGLVSESGVGFGGLFCRVQHRRCPMLQGVPLL